MVTTMADLDMTKDFDYARYQFVALISARLHFTVIFFSAEAMDRLLQCATHALPYFSASVSFSYDHKDIEYPRTRRIIDRL